MPTTQYRVLGANGTPPLAEKVARPSACALPASNPFCTGTPGTPLLSAYNIIQKELPRCGFRTSAMTDLNRDGSLPVSNGIAFQTVAEIKVGEPALFPCSRFERRMVLAPADSPAASPMLASTPDTITDQNRCAFLRAFICLGYLFSSLIWTLREVPGWRE